jgi:hypothetical protein
VHNEDYSVSEEAVFTGFDPNNRYRMLFQDPLSFTPLAGYIVDIPNYSTSTLVETNALYKIFHDHWSPQVTIVTGISNTQFTVSVGDASKFQAGFPIRVHNEDFAVTSDEVRVSDVTGVTITVDEDLGFTPSAGQFADFLGFADGQECYRYV